jgi:anti-sigma factor (TIGR02949 family)
MECDEVRPKLDPYIDGEIPAAERGEVARHVATCPLCRGESEALLRLRDAIRGQVPQHAAPEELRSRIRFELRRAAPETAPGPARASRLLAYAASVLLSLAIGSGTTLLVLDDRRGGPDGLETEVFDSHLRSLLGTHLTDVASSDQHSVKPWFAGRTELSPPVIDLTGEGFPLVGGRLDLFGGKPVPALVYRRRDHVINLFVVPARGADPTQQQSRHGYSLRRWHAGDLDFWAVSDLNPTELGDFERQYRAATGT